MKDINFILDRLKENEKIAKKFHLVESRVLSILNFKDFFEVLLCVWADLHASTSANVCFDLFPIFTIQLVRFNKEAFFFFGPTTSRHRVLTSFVVFFSSSAFPKIVFGIH